MYDSSTGQWHFIEALVAGGGESLENPCDKWFCNPASMAAGTQVFATRWNFFREFFLKIMCFFLPDGSRQERFTQWPGTWPTLRLQESTELNIIKVFAISADLNRHKYVLYFGRIK